MDSLHKRTYASVIGTLGYIWIFLFAPSWSLTFWQGWIFWFVFLIPVIFVTLYFLKNDPVFMESRLHAGPFAEKEKTKKLSNFLYRVFSRVATASWFGFPVSLVKGSGATSMYR
jgi:hypothetical protein